MTHGRSACWLGVAAGIFLLGYPDPSAFGQSFSSGSTGVSGPSHLPRTPAWCSLQTAF